MSPVKTTHAVIDPLAGWSTGQAIAKAADNMAKRVAAECVRGQQHEVGKQDESANTDAELAVEPERIPHVACQE